MLPLLLSVIDEFSSATGTTKTPLQKEIERLLPASQRQDKRKQKKNQRGQRRIMPVISATGGSSNNDESGMTSTISQATTTTKRETETKTMMTVNEGSDDDVDADDDDDDDDDDVDDDDADDDDDDGDCTKYQRQRLSALFTHRKPERQMWFLEAHHQEKRLLCRVGFPQRGSVSQFLLQILLVQIVCKMRQVGSTIWTDHRIVLAENVCSRLLAPRHRRLRGSVEEGTVAIAVTEIEER